jgi:hypothetical protein
MSYPTVSRADARSYLQKKRDEPAGEQDLNICMRDEGADLDWEEAASQLIAELTKLQSPGPVKKGDPRGNQFEKSASTIVHERLPQHPALTDPEFWTWLAVVHGQEIVDWRYGSAGSLANFGAGPAGENFFFRLWLRADIGFDAAAEDSYGLAKLGDIDFWRSHVFRQGYGEVRAFTRALLDFQFPAAEGHKARLSHDDIRDLVKRLKRARTNLMFELMTEARARDYIESEWATLA